MKFFEPQVSIIKHTHLDAPNEYFVHAVTFCNNTQFYADSYAIESRQSNSNSLLLLSLFINRKTDIPELNCVTPIAHTISLGNYDGAIEIKVVNKDKSKNDSGGMVNKSAVSTSDATEIDKPIYSDSVASLWQANFGTKPVFIKEG